MRKVSALTAAAGLALACCSCDGPSEKAFKEEMKAYKEEMVRHVYGEVLGPPVAAGIIGSATPSGGPSVLHALGTDRAWGVRFASADSEPDAAFVPSMLGVPAPSPDREARVRVVRELLGTRDRSEGKPSAPPAGR